MTHLRRGRKNLLAALGMLAAVTLVTMPVAGCAPRTPYISDQKVATLTNLTLEDQRAWVAEQLDSAVAASGIKNGWAWTGGNPSPRWAEDLEEDRAKILGSLMPRTCGTGGYVSAVLKNFDAPDPLALAAPIRAHWERNGWEVRDLWSSPTYEEPNFLATRDDGASVAFEATSTRMALAVQSPCSGNASVISPYYTSPDQNEFAEELAKREDAGEGVGDEDGPETEQQ